MVARLVAVGMFALIKASTEHGVNNLKYTKLSQWAFRRSDAQDRAPEFGKHLLAQMVVFCAPGMAAMRIVGEYSTEFGGAFELLAPLGVDRLCHIDCSVEVLMRFAVTSAI